MCAENSDGRHIGLFKSILIAQNIHIIVIQLLFLLVVISIDETRVQQDKVMRWCKSFDSFIFISKQLKDKLTYQHENLIVLKFLLKTLSFLFALSVVRQHLKTNRNPSQYSDINLSRRQNEREREMGLIEFNAFSNNKNSIFFLVFHLFVSLRRIY